MGLVLKDDHLGLRVVRHVSVVVDTTRLEPCSTHDPASTSDKKQLETVLGALIVNIALNQPNEPVSGDALRLKLLAHVEVPHVAGVHGALIADKRRLSLLHTIVAYSHCTLLRRHC